MACAAALLPGRLSLSGAAVAAGRACCPTKCCSVGSRAQLGRLSSSAAFAPSSQQSLLSAVGSSDCRSRQQQQGSRDYHGRSKRGHAAPVGVAAAFASGAVAYVAEETVGNAAAAVDVADRVAVVVADSAVATADALVIAAGPGDALVAAAGPTADEVVNVVDDSFVFFDSGDPVLNGFIAFLFVLAFLGLVVLTVGVAYLGYSEWRDRREAEELQKQSAAGSSGGGGGGQGSRPKAKAGGSGKASKAVSATLKTSPKGFGRRESEDGDEL